MDTKQQVQVDFIDPIKKQDLDQFSLRAMFGGKSYEPITMEDYTEMVTKTLVMPWSEIIKFLEGRFATPLFYSTSSNIMIKAFMFLNIVAERRPEARLGNFETLLNAINLVRKDSEAEKRRFQIVKAKIISDILVPLYVRKVIEKHTTEEGNKLRFQRLQEIKNYAENLVIESGYTIDDFENKIVEALDTYNKFLQTEHLSPYDDFVDKEKEISDWEVTRAYLEQHPEEFIGSKLAA